MPPGQLHVNWINRMVFDCRLSDSNPEYQDPSPILSSLLCSLFAKPCFENSHAFHLASFGTLICGRGWNGGANRARRTGRAVRLSTYLNTQLYYSYRYPSIAVSPPKIHPFLAHFTTPQITSVLYLRHAPKSGSRIRQGNPATGDVVLQCMEEVQVKETKSG